MGDGLNQWLYSVDDQLSTEAFPLLRFGLYSEVQRYLSEVEKLDKPSQLYHFLLEHHGWHSESEVLRIFIHVLRGLGRKLRGTLVLREGFSKYKLEDPGELNIEKASSEFRLFQCLLKILTQVRKDSKLSNRLKTRLSRVLKKHPSQFKNLPELFIALYQEGSIAVGETDHLKRVLEKYDKEADVDHKEVVCQCLEILEGYHSNLPTTVAASSDPSSAVSK